MEKKSGNTNRIGIFVFYDPAGWVDRYVETLLADLRKNMDELVIVSNGAVADEERGKLEAYADRFLVRENIGYDIGAYQEAMLTVGWETISEYGELVLCNDTVMGPIWPFREMFEEMAQRPVDFWGITKHYALPDNPFAPGEELKEHIQSYFMVFRRKVIQDARFQRYWNELPLMQSYQEAVAKHEICFTARLNEWGYSYDTYIDEEVYRKDTPDPVMVYPDLLVEKNRCPVVKRRIFTNDYTVTLHDSAGGAPARVLRYLEEHTDYDVGMIWENILRIGKRENVANNLQLRYVLDPKESSGQEPVSKEPLKMALVLLNAGQDRWKQYESRILEKIPVYRMSEEQFFSEEGTGCVQSYDLIGILTPGPETAISGSAGKDREDGSWEHLVCSEVYLDKISDCFRSHPYLGSLYPPPAYYGQGAEPEKLPVQISCGWYRREVLEGKRKQTSALFYEAAVYNADRLPEQLTNEEYRLKEARQQAVHWKENHDRAVAEWQQAVKKAEEYKEAHDRVAAEWKNATETIERLEKMVQEYKEAHDRVVEEWNKTAEAYRQVSEENKVLKNTKAYKIAQAFHKHLVLLFLVACLMIPMQTRAQEPEDTILGEAWSAAVCMTAEETAVVSEENEPIQILRMVGQNYYSKAAEALEIVNQERSRENLEPLVMDAELSAAAMQRAAECSVFYSHTRPDGLACVTASSKCFGENIAASTGMKFSTAEAVMTAWMDSPGHRANILTAEYRSIGIGCFYKDGVWYWAQEFGREAAEPAEMPEDGEGSYEIAALKKYAEPFLAVEDFTIEKGQQVQYLVRLSNLGWSSASAYIAQDSYDWISSSGCVTTTAEGEANAAGWGEARITADNKGAPEIFLSGSVNVCTDAEITEADPVYVQQQDQNGLVAGLPLQLSRNTDVEYSWYAAAQGSTSQIQDWTENQEWITWIPDRFGEYTVTVKARVAGNRESSAEQSITYNYHPKIRGKCQMPYDGPGGGYLIGVESYDNPEQEYRYEMLILDCTLLAEGKDAWIYSTGQCALDSGSALWTVWQPEYGYYWTLFRIFDGQGNLLDEECYGFQNI